MSKTTHDLLVEARQILTALDESGGELTQEIELGIEKWLEESGDKLGALRAVRMASEAEAGLLDQEIKHLQARKRSRERLAEQMNERALAILQARAALGEEPVVRTPYYTAYLASVDVVECSDDPNEWPTRFVRLKTEPDKKAALAALKAGESIRGFSLLTRHYVRWS